MTQRIDLKILTAFVTVAREGNVSRAAEILCLTQPAVSLQLRRLAQETGLELFTRNAKGLELTPDGHALLVKAQRICTELDEFNLFARHLTRSVRGRLRIGTIIDPEFIRLGDFLQELVQQAPDLRPELAHGMSGEILRRVVRDQLDVGYFLGSSQDFTALIDEASCVSATDLSFHRLTDLSYRILAPRGWEMRLRGLGWADLAALPWIGTPVESVHSRLLERIFAPLELRQNIVTLADQETSMLELVRAGMGLCLSRDSVALHEHHTHGLAIVKDLSLETTLHFITMKSRLGDPRIALATEVIERAWRRR